LILDSQVIEITTYESKVSIFPVVLFIDLTKPNLTYQTFNVLTYVISMIWLSMLRPFSVLRDNHKTEQIY
jgi:hypothetical protein